MTTSTVVPGSADNGAIIKDAKQRSLVYTIGKIASVIVGALVGVTAWYLRTEVGDTANRPFWVLTITAIWSLVQAFGFHIAGVNIPDLQIPDLGTRPPDEADGDPLPVASD